MEAAPHRFAGLLAMALLAACGYQSDPLAGGSCAVPLHAGEVAAPRATSCPTSVEFDDTTYLVSCGAAIESRNLGEIQARGKDASVRYVLRDITGVPFREAGAVSMKHRPGTTMSGFIDADQCGRWKLAASDELSESELTRIAEQFTYDPRLRGGQLELA